VDVNGEFDLIGIGFPISGNHYNNVESANIDRVEITGPTPILTTFHNLIFLKDEVKNIGVNAQNEFNFELIIDRDISNQGEH
jgi:hypothetical protein